MKNYLTCLGAYTLLLFWTAQAAAQSELLLQASSATVDINASVQITLTLSGLSADGSNTLAGYQVQIHFDQAVLRFDSIAFGSSLGVADSDPSTTIAPPFESAVVLNQGPGLVDIAYVSLLSSADLDALQMGALSLATLRFTSISQGNSPVGLDNVVAVDALGARLPVTPVDGAVQVGQGAGSAAPAAIPTLNPWTLTLLSVFLLGTGGFCLKTKRAAVYFLAVASWRRFIDQCRSRRPGGNFR